MLWTQKAVAESFEKSRLVDGVFVDAFVFSESESSLGSSLTPTPSELCGENPMDVRRFLMLMF